MNKYFLTSVITTISFSTQAQQEITEAQITEAQTYMVSVGQCASRAYQFKKLAKESKTRATLQQKAMLHRLKELKIPKAEEVATKHYAYTHTQITYMFEDATAKIEKCADYVPVELKPAFLIATKRATKNATK